MTDRALLEISVCWEGGYGIPHCIIDCCDRAVSEYTFVDTEI